MITAILVDDEAACTDVLHWQLSNYCPAVQVIGEYNIPELAVQHIREKEPDLVFLDIDMPGMNAFEMLNLLKPFSFDVIFVTAYNQYAIQAFKEKAVDYLLKPVEKSDLILAVDKVLHNEKARSVQKVEELLQVFKDQLRSNKKIALPTNEGISFLNVDEIVRVESDSNYSFVCLASKEKVCITKTLKQIEEALEGHPFYRVHQSHLVNLNHILKFVKDGGGYLVMSDNETITVARQRKDGFMDMFSRL